MFRSLWKYQGESKDRLFDSTLTCLMPFKHLDIWYHRLRIYYWSWPYHSLGWKGVSYHLCTSEKIWNSKKLNHLAKVTKPEKKWTCLFWRVWENHYIVLSLILWHQLLVYGETSSFLASKPAVFWWHHTTMM